MVSSSKILTVSYGTFSCTAEGFDDPLAVVKDTTQFFRGVVGEDRFFGAEPPQFDPELATELMREQLGSAHGAGTVSLGRPGAASSGAMTAALSAGPARARAEAPALPDDDTIEATAVLTERPLTDGGLTAPLAQDAAPAAAPRPDPGLDATPAEGLRADPEAPPPVTDVAPDDGLTPALDSADLAKTSQQAIAGDPGATDAIAPSAAMVETAETPVGAATPTMVHEASALEGGAPAPRPSDHGGIAAKLDRIRAVVAGNAGAPVAAVAAAAGPTGPQAFVTEPPAQETYDTDSREEDETSGPGDEVDDAALSALLTELEAGNMGAEAEEPALKAGEETAEDDADSRFADSIAGLMAEERSMAEGIGALPVDNPDAPAAVSAWDMDDEDDRQPFESFDDAEISDEMMPAATAGTEIDEDNEDEGFDDEALAPRPEAPKPAPTPIRARVVKVKRADFEKAVASGRLEEIEDDRPAPATGSSLSAEEEEELARELAAVKAELSAGFDDWDDEDDEDEGEDVEIAATKDADADAAASDWDADDLDDEEDEDDFDARLTTATSTEALSGTGAEPLRLDNPITRPDRDWGTDINALDARASAAFGQDQAKDEDGEDAEDTSRLAIDEAVRDSARKAVKMASPARAMLTEREVADQDTSRLIDQTNSEMDEPEGNRRRSAIAHLRAAVAATKADRLLGRKAQAEDEEEAYREDLASVVRPRRPQAPAERTERPAQPAAPLKLVAEQRVGEEAAPAATPQTVPIRPRRVRRVADAPSPRDLARSEEDEASTSGFASYAESVGADALPELLEAAAAYMSYVEGRDQFSRPQLMTTVRQAEVTESSREDRLRSFGQLLREGKIRKTTGGRFTASDRISFRPDREAV
ncbi:hypothetical protein [Ponticoccus alexandrii]|uniref:hypothetical protein n=1 Tax=Ponticoccus alexandrii TaxID=1943633 RepID=UPI000579AA22|nr:hypothetical protein [Ponticoccus alexandrii]KID12495.1 hypothetical protein P279_27900 [Rhodobacteraceae bacterium PD-2]